jgi:hypothetical protein
MWEIRKADFERDNRNFLIVGILLPGFTSGFIVSIQQLIISYRINCEQGWSIVWIISWILSIILPVLFFITIKKFNKSHNRLKLLLFNLVEYMAIQFALGSLLSDNYTLCYGNGGQNGLELIFTGWIAIPILFIIHLLFKNNLLMIIE